MLLGLFDHLVLQKGQGASSIQGRWTLNSNNRLDVIFQTIYKASGKAQSVRWRVISRELINQTRKTLYILSHSTSLSNVEKLTQQQLMVITVEAIMNSFAKIKPLNVFKSFFNRLDLATS